MIQSNRSVGSSSENSAPMKMKIAEKAKAMTVVLTCFSVARGLSREMMSVKIAPCIPYGRRNVMVTIMTRVAQMTIRATRAALPGYGASSSLRNSQNQTDGPDDSGKFWATVAILNYE